MTRLKKIKQDFDDVMKGNVTLEQPFLSGIIAAGNAAQTVVPSEYPDRRRLRGHAGLYHRRCLCAGHGGIFVQSDQTFSQLGLNIHFAKIATRVDGIVDSFYVLDEDNAPIRSDERSGRSKKNFCTEFINSSTYNIIPII